MNALSLYRIMCPAHFWLPEVFLQDSRKNRSWVSGVYSCARPTKRVISDVNWWVSGFAHIRRDVKVVFFYIIKASTLSRHQRHPFSFGWEKRNKRAPRKIFQFPTGSGHLGHGFGKQLVYDLIYTCSRRDFIDEYINPFTRAEKCLKREGDFETLLTIFLLTWKGKAQKQNKKKS
jgi:hypothetical protein